MKQKLNEDVKCIIDKRELEDMLIDRIKNSEFKILDCGDYDLTINEIGQAIIEYHDNVVRKCKLKFDEIDGNCADKVFELIERADAADSQSDFEQIINEIENYFDFQKVDFENYEINLNDLDFGKETLTFDGFSKEIVITFDRIDDEDDEDFGKYIASCSTNPNYHVFENIEDLELIVESCLSEYSYYLIYEFLDDNDNDCIDNFEDDLDRIFDKTYE